MNEPLPSSKPTEEDEFYVHWARETVKANLEIVRDVLALLMKLNTALLGGSIIFLEPESISVAWKTSALGFFFVALFVAFLGVLPHQSRASVISPEQIRTHKQDALTKKSNLMWCSAISTGLGLFILAFGAIYA